MYGPVRTVVWQGSAGNRRPYADQTGLSPSTLKCQQTESNLPSQVSLRDNFRLARQNEAAGADAAARVVPAVLISRLRKFVGHKEVSL